MRLPQNNGYGGTLELPLGPVQVSAAAVVAVIDGQPSFLAIMGAQFLPPIQLSFGFSLDRVGGIVGVNRRADTDALRSAQSAPARPATSSSRSARQPSPLALVSAADRLFPFNRGTHLVGPSLKLSWLSFGPEGSLIGLDLAVIVEIPTGKVVILGVARASIPGLPFVLNLRLDVLGIIDPVEQLVSIDASLVDSHVLGIFEVYGDAAMRLSWGTGRLPASRRSAASIPGSIRSPRIFPRCGASAWRSTTRCRSSRSAPRATSPSRRTRSSSAAGWEVGISLGIEAHGFVQVDAIVQFRPFHFEAARRRRIRRLGRRVSASPRSRWRARSPGRARSSSMARSASTCSSSPSRGTRRSRSAAGHRTRCRRRRC